MRNMLDTCRGKDFDDRRDLALLMFLADTGVRRGELVNLDLEDVLLNQQVAIVRACSTATVPWPAVSGRWPRTGDTRRWTGWSSDERDQAPPMAVPDGGTGLPDPRS
jgi:integrase